MRKYNLAAFVTLAFINSTVHGSGMPALPGTHTTDDDTSAAPAVSAPQSQTTSSLELIGILASFLDTKTLGAFKCASKAVEILYGKELEQRKAKYLERLMVGFSVVYPKGQPLQAKILTLPVGHQVATIRSIHLLTAGIPYGYHKDSIIEALNEVPSRQSISQFVEYVQALTTGMDAHKKISIIKALSKVSSEHLTPQFMKYAQALKEKKIDPIDIISNLEEVPPEELTDEFMEELMEGK